MPLTFQRGSGGKITDKKSEPKERRNFKGRDYILEESIFGEVALIKAWKADTAGNLIYKDTARNFNQDMATAAKCVIVEAEEIVEAGELHPNDIHTPGVYVDRVYKSPAYEKRIERVVYDKSN